MTASLHQHTDLRSATRGIELGAFLDQLTTAVGSNTHRYTRQAMETPIPTGAKRFGDHLARYCGLHRDHAAVTATPAAMRRTPSHPPPPPSRRRYQLVTPFSGAVVLETKRDFEAAGLDQLDPSSTAEHPKHPRARQHQPDPPSTRINAPAPKTLALRLLTNYPSSGRLREPILIPDHHRPSAPLALSRTGIQQDQICQSSKGVK